MIGPCASARMDLPRAQNHDTFSVCANQRLCLRWKNSMSHASFRPVKLLSGDASSTLLPKAW